jgi:hypothetical protein
VGGAAWAAGWGWSHGGVLARGRQGALAWVGLLGKKIEGENKKDFFEIFGLKDLF